MTYGTLDNPISLESNKELIKKKIDNLTSQQLKEL